MSFTRLTDDLNVIGKLPDDPNDSGGLSAGELKAKFDEAANTIKAYINSVFLEELESEDAAGDIGITTIDGIDTATNVQAALEAIVEAMQDISQGGIADGGVTATKLATAAVETEKINDGAVTSGKIADGAVIDGKVGTGAVGTTNLKDNAVTSAKLADGAVTAGKLAEGAITGESIGAGSVNSEKLGQYAVTTEKLAGASVTTEKIAANAVSTVYSGSLVATGWNGTAAPYSQAVTVDGILSTDEPIIDFTPSSTYATAMLQEEAWGYIYRAVTSADTITFYAKEKPTAKLNFKARCIRK